MAAKKEKIDVYGIVTERISAKLEEGIVPWRRPWRSLGGDGQHRNVISQSAYRGINVFLLDAENYTRPWWLSANQANKIGGYVREGEKHSLVTFWKRIEKKAEPDWKGPVNRSRGSTTGSRGTGPSRRPTRSCRWRSASRKRWAT
jgi:antirestriction protein ArdC